MSNTETTGVVLLVEDNKKLLKANRLALEGVGYKVLSAETLAEAREILSEEKPDAAVLDIMLPDGDGLEFLPELRSICKIPVLFLTSKVEQEEIIKGLQAGGNGYITKPYRIDELCARVESAINWELSRHEEMEMPEKITKGALVLDMLSSQAYINDTIMDLTSTEYKLLHLCMKNEGEIMSFESIYETVWRRPLVNNRNAVQAAVKRLRQKIESTGYDIHAVRNNGYVFRKKNITI